MSEPVDFVTAHLPGGGTWTDLTRLTDGRVMCCLCFEYTPRGGLEPDMEHPGCVTDVCKPCAARERSARADGLVPPSCGHEH